MTGVQSTVQRSQQPNFGSKTSKVPLGGPGIGGGGGGAGAGGDGDGAAEHAAAAAEPTGHTTLPFNV